MLKAQFRLKGGTRFQKSRFLKTPYFTLRAAQNNLSFSRFGFIVSKKIDKRATVRNRVKRVIRSCIEKEHEKIQPGYDMLFIVQKDAVTVPADVLWSSIQNVLKKEGCLL